MAKKFKRKNASERHDRADRIRNMEKCFALMAATDKLIADIDKQFEKAYASLDKLSQSKNDAGTDSET